MHQALPDIFDSLPGGALGLGGGGLAALLIVVAVLAQQGTPADRERFNRSIEQGIGAAVSVIGRYLSGRELSGVPRSEATWWKAGAPLPDDRATETPVDELGAPAVNSTGSFTKAGNTGGAGRLVRVVTAPVRLLWGALGGLVRVLRVWHRWPRAARSAARLAPFLTAYALWRFPSETPIALIAVAGAALLAALTSPSGLGWWHVAPVWTHGQIYGPGVWVAVRQILRMEDTEPRSRWLSVPDDIAAADARMVLRVPASWIGGPEAVAAIERVIEERVPGDWVPEWHRTAKEHFVQWTPKPKPKPKPVLPDYVPWRLTGDPRRVFLGLTIEGDSM
ncbi:hypothetical protein [Streptomyces sp. H27-H5]|uniref:hypothetical protein n=1 Tax=Streptomyces sp. H27-H5 TaxID=2996460 RepID=UPI0022716A63|nr:hypothetical protein [Streptomyces sp. H27-H5]MCY0961493.1 hypothetical protein [Streptomyces sp. H27-H5]